MCGRRMRSCKASTAQSQLLWQMATRTFWRPTCGTVALGTRRAAWSTLRLRKCEFIHSNFSRLAIVRTAFTCLCLMSNGIRTDAYHEFHAFEYFLLHPCKTKP